MSTSGCRPNWACFSQEGDHFYFHNFMRPSSWPDGKRVLVGEDAVDFDMTFNSLNPRIRHCPHRSEARPASKVGTAAKSGLDERAGRLSPEQLGRDHEERRWQIRSRRRPRDFHCRPHRQYQRRSHRQRNNAEPRHHHRAPLRRRRAHKMPNPNATKSFAKSRSSPNRNFLPECIILTLHWCVAVGRVPATVIRDCKRAKFRSSNAYGASAFQREESPGRDWNSNAK